MRVRFECVTKRFGAHNAVDHVDLDVDAGECLVLLGPSAAARRRCCGSSPGSSASTPAPSGSATAAWTRSSPPRATSRWSFRTTAL